MPKRFIFLNESKSGDLRDEKWVGTHRRGKSKQQEGQKEQEKKSFGHPLLMGPGNSGFLPGACELSVGPVLSEVSMRLPNPFLCVQTFDFPLSFYLPEVKLVT